MTLDPRIEYTSAERLLVEREELRAVVRNKTQLISELVDEIERLQRDLQVVTAAHHTPGLRFCESCKRYALREG